MSLNRTIQRLLGNTAPNVPPVEREQHTDPKQAIVDFLAVEGIQASPDADGDITFERGGLHFALLFDARDPEFVALVLPGIDKATSDADRAALGAIAQRIAGQLKAVKLSVMADGNVWVMCEWLVASPLHVVPVLLRACESLEASVKAYAVLRKF